MNFIPQSFFCLLFISFSPPFPLPIHTLFTPHFLPTLAISRLLSVSLNLHGLDNRLKHRVTLSSIYNMLTPLFPFPPEVDPTVYNYDLQQLRELWKTPDSRPPVINREVIKNMEHQLVLSRDSCPDDYVRVGVRVCFSPDPIPGTSEGCVVVRLAGARGDSIFAGNNALVVRPADDCFLIDTAVAVVVAGNLILGFSRFHSNPGRH